MRYTYQLSFYGTVENDDKVQRETLEDIRSHVLGSYDVDLVAGVKLEGMSIHVDAVREAPSAETINARGPAE